MGILPLPFSERGTMQLQKSPGQTITHWSEVCLITAAMMVWRLVLWIQNKTLWDPEITSCWVNSGKPFHLSEPEIFLLYRRGGTTRVWKIIAKLNKEKCIIVQYIPLKLTSAHVRQLFCDLFIPSYCLLSSSLLTFSESNHPVALSFIAHMR